ncbi:hypothetical protein [Gemmata sp.]|uniref:hypothetical protein n=1 Tax=Gemmata sp. TaxID=1914242 RepID=UPI003F721D55
MNDLDQLAISRILGSTVRPFTRSSFGGFSKVKVVGEMLGARPPRPVKLLPDVARDALIVRAFEKAHRGFSVDRTLADPELSRQFVANCHRLGVKASHAAICRRLLRLRKSGDFQVVTTREEKRSLTPFLIPAELAFAQLTYRYDASHDDLIADPEVGEAYDSLASKLGRGRGSVVDYRLAALHLRKNIRSRARGEVAELARFDFTDISRRWHTIDTLDRIKLSSVPQTQGILSLVEPNRFLYLTRCPDLRSGMEVFQDGEILTTLGGGFWKPSFENIMVNILGPEDTNGANLRLVELKSLEVYRPVFNMLPVAA